MINEVSKLYAKSHFDFFSPDIIYLVVAYGREKGKKKDLLLCRDERAKAGLGNYNSICVGVVGFRKDKVIIFERSLVLWV